MKKKIIFKILIAVLLLSWLLFKSDISLIIENIIDLPIIIFLSAVIISLIYLLIKTFRWRLLLGRFPIIKLVELSFISQFYSIVSVGQFVGEAAKIYILSKGEKESGQITMSVVIDKITGIIGVIIVALFGLFFTSTVLPKNLSWTFILAAVICLILLFLVRLYFVYSLLSKLFSHWSNTTVRLKKIFVWIVNLLEAWYSYSKKIKNIVISIILSIIFQLILVGFYMVLSYGLGIKVSFFDWCWVLGILTAILVLPITVGGIGVREGSLVGLLGIFMISPEKALALSFSVFAVQLVLAVIGGIIEAKRVKIFKIKLSV